MRETPQLSQSVYISLRVWAAGLYSSYGAEVICRVPCSLFSTSPNALWPFLPPWPEFSSSRSQSAAQDVAYLDMH